MDKAKVVKGFATACFTVFVLALAYYAVFGFMLARELSPQTDIASYDEIKEQWSTNLVGHFPETADRATLDDGLAFDQRARKAERLWDCTASTCGRSRGLPTLQINEC